LVADFFEEGSVSCDYAEKARALPVERQKLACNMLAVAAEPLIRGGSLVLDADATALEVRATGEGGGLSPDIRAALSLAVTAGELNSRTVAAYFTGLLARRLGLRIVIADLAGGFRLALAAAG
jgi:hypothetical protein